MLDTFQDLMHLLQMRMVFAMVSPSPQISSTQLVT